MRRHSSAMDARDAGSQWAGHVQPVRGVEDDKVVGEIGSDALPTQKVTSISKTDKGLVLNYSFPWEGNSIDAVVSLTPGTDDKVAAQMDFAGGAYTMTGTATKKEKSK